MVKRSKTGIPGNARAVKTPRKPVVKTRGRTRTGPAVSRDGGGWAVADEQEGDESESMEGLDVLMPPAAQEPALAARRRIEQLREEKWLHDALNDFPDG